MPTPATFQQLVTVDSSAYANLESPNLQNVGFFSSNGTMIPSWLESGNSSGSTDTVYWLNLRNPIFGGTDVTVYMGFASRGSNLFNDRTTGEASQLSPGYGEYDDGAHVFPYYTDFAGSSLPTGWTSHASLHLTNVSYSVNNGLTLPSQHTCCGSIDYNKTYGSGTMIDVDATVTGQTGGNGEYGGIVGYRLLQERGQTYWGVAGRLSSVYYTLQTCYVGPCTYLVSNKTYTSGTHDIGSIGFNGTDVVATNNYGAYVTKTPDLNAFPEAPTIQQGSSGLSLLIQWLRVRESPPNGVMPTVSLGSLYLSMTIRASEAGSVGYSLSGGAGTVQGGANLTIYVPAGDAVSLTPSPSLLYTFSGWTGALSGTGSQTITVNSPISVQASFSLNAVLLGGIAAMVIIVIVLAVVLVRRRPKATLGSGG